MPAKLTGIERQRVAKATHERVGEPAKGPAPAGGDDAATRARDAALKHAAELFLASPTGQALMTWLGEGLASSRVGRALAGMNKTAKTSLIVTGILGAATGVVMANPENLEADLPLGKVLGDKMAAGVDLGSLKLHIKLQRPLTRGKQHFFMRLSGTHDLFGGR